MTPIADMIEQMFSESAPQAAILAAVRAMERVTFVTRDTALQSRVTKRDGNKKRQAARRERLRLQILASEAQANDGASRHALVTRDERDSTNPPCDLLSSIKEEGLSKEGRKERKKEGLEIARATRMQAGAILTEPFRDAAIELGARADEIPGAWAEFVDYWIGVPGSRGTKLDWLATWRNRVRDVLKRGKGNFNGRRTIHEAADDLLAKVRALDAPAPSGIRDGTGENPVRLLSSR